MNTAIKLDCQAMLKAVEVDNPVLDSALTTKLGACSLAAQQTPRCLFSVGLAPT